MVFFIQDFFSLTKFPFKREPSATKADSMTPVSQRRGPDTIGRRKVNDATDDLVILFRPSWLTLGVGFSGTRWAELSGHPSFEKCSNRLSKDIQYMIDSIRLQRPLMGFFKSFELVLGSGNENELLAGATAQ